MLGLSNLSHLGNVSGRLLRLVMPNLSMRMSKMVRVTNSAVKIELTRPISSVMPKPFTSSEPRQQQTNQARAQAGMEVIGAQLRADRALADRLFGQLRGKRAGVERAHQIIEIGLRKSLLAAVDRAAAADLRIDARRADDLLVQHDR